MLGEYRAGRFYDQQDLRIEHVSHRALEVDECTFFWTIDKLCV